MLQLLLLLRAHAKEPAAEQRPHGRAPPFSLNWGVPLFERKAQRSQHAVRVYGTARAAAWAISILTVGCWCSLASNLLIPMAKTPAKKKARVVSTSVAGGGAASTVKNGCPSPEEFITPELVARVAGYSAFDEGNTMDICLAVGPGVSRKIRHTYLRKNTNYLRTTLSHFMAANYEKEKSRMNIQSWMSINPEWKQEQPLRMLKNSREYR